MPAIDISPLPLLTTDRLVLRQPTHEDDKALFVLRSDEAVNKFIERSAPASLEDVRKFIERLNASISKNESGYWAICMKDIPELIGTICLWNFSNDGSSAELGYELLPGFQGRGIMHEAVKKIIGFAFSKLQLQKIEGWTDPGNIASTKILLKHGFVRDIERENDEAIKPHLGKMVIYSLNKDQYVPE